LKETELLNKPFSDTLRN